VAFGSGSQYEFVVTEAEVVALGRVAAVVWFDDEWLVLDCTPTNPVGKILMLDKVLGVAKYGGEKRFAERGECHGSTVVPSPRCSTAR